MASMKDLKKRIGTVKNTQQTTRAMKLVSAAKLRRAQDGITANRPYARKIDRLIRMTSAMSEAEIESKLISYASPIPQSQRKVLLVLVSSDRGLCGAFNGNIIKKGMNWQKQMSSAYAKVDLGFVGRKAHEICKARGATPVFYKEMGRKVKFDLARFINDEVVKKYLNGEYDEVKFVYNEFKNAVTQTVVVEDFLPLHQDEAEKLTQLQDDEVAQVEKLKVDTAAADRYMIKPDPKSVLESLLKRHFAIQIYRVLLESQASEHGARMSAMENATKNAGEMIKGLTLQYNKQRQAGITKELLEIISGSESQKGSA